MQGLYEYFISKGFVEGEICNQMSCYGIKEKNEFKLCIVVNNTAFKKYSSYELCTIEKNLREDMKSKGYSSLEILFLLYTDDVERDRDCINNSQVWLLDTKNRKVIIYDNQPQFFAGLGQWIEVLAFDNNRAKRKLKFSIVSLLLVCINIIVFFVLEYKGSTLDVEYMLNHGASSWQYEFREMELYRLFTCMFIHFGIDHLINNMIMLYVIGYQIEDLYGRYKFLFIYLSSGLLASISSSIFNMLMGRDNIISGGASGAIYGIMGALMIALWFNRAKLERIVKRVIIVLVITIYGGFTETGVDNVAHIAGFLSGIVISIIIVKIINKRHNSKPS